MLAVTYIRSKRSLTFPQAKKCGQIVAAGFFPVLHCFFIRISTIAGAAFLREADPFR
jgi:hypothetical protein